MNLSVRNGLNIVFRWVIAITMLLTTIQLASAQNAVIDTTAFKTSTVPTSGFPSAMDSVPGVRFLHVARWDNLDGDTTYIDHPLTNGNPNAIVFITQNWNPGGVGGTYNNHPVGVWYNSSQSKWGIFNEDEVDMVEGMAFNVLIPEPGPNVFVHEVTATGSISTLIDHPLTNNNPDALLFVTQNWNPGGGPGVYNTHPVGVYYNASPLPEWQKWHIAVAPIDPLPLGAAFNVMVLNASPNTFVHETMAENITSNSTYIDHPLANNNPNALLLVTAKGYYSYINSVNGVWYNSTRGQWAIFNQHLGNMSVGRSFNVTVLVTESAFFVHEATAGNSTDNSTFIDHPLTNNKSNAIMIVTQNWNPGGTGGTYNPHSTGVWYSNSAQKWAVFNQDIADMTIGVPFNVLVPAVGANVFVHSATATNTTGNSTFIDHPLTNNKPNAIVLVTPNWNPGGISGRYNDHPIGVWYSNSAQKWAVFNQDGTAIPNGVDFNVLVPAASQNAFVHTATAGNVSFSGLGTLIDNPLSNNHPNALVFVTQNWNPGGIGGTYNNFPIGVWYSLNDQKWTIRNQTVISIPEGASFNVIVMSHIVYLPLVIR